MSEWSEAEVFEQKLRSGGTLTAHEKQVVKMARQQRHINRIERKIIANHPKADILTVRLREHTGVREEIGHAEELARLRDRRRSLRQGDVVVEPQTGGKDAAGEQPSVGS